MPELIAYHEAGHALIALLLSGKVKQVTIEPDNDDGPDRQGDIQVLWQRSGIFDKEFAKMAVQVCLAGPVAEMIYAGYPYHPGLVAEWAADWREAWEAAIPLHADERKRIEYLEQVSIQLYRRLKDDGQFPDLMPQWCGIAARQAPAAPSTGTRYTRHHVLACFDANLRPLVLVVPRLPAPRPLRLGLHRWRLGVRMLRRRWLRGVLRCFTSEFRHLGFEFGDPGQQQADHRLRVHQSLRQHLVREFKRHADVMTDDLPSRNPNQSPTCERLKRWESPFTATVCSRIYSTTGVGSSSP